MSFFHIRMTPMGKSFNSSIIHNLKNARGFLFLFFRHDEKSVKLQQNKKNFLKHKLFVNQIIQTCYSNLQIHFCLFFFIFLLIFILHDMRHER